MASKLLTDWLKNDQSLTFVKETSESLAQHHFLIIWRKYKLFRSVNAKIRYAREQESDDFTLLQKSYLKKNCLFVCLLVCLFVFFAENTWNHLFNWWRSVAAIDSKNCWNWLNTLPSHKMLSCQTFFHELRWFFFCSFVAYRGRAFFLHWIQSNAAI